MSVIKNNDFLMGLFLIIASIVLYINTLELSSDAQLFPNIIILIIFVNAFVMIIKSIKASKTQPKTTGQRKTVNQHVLLMIGSLFIYYFLISIIGFYASSFLFALSSYLLMNKSIAINSIMKGGIFGISFIVVVYILFHVLLKLSTPSGILI